MSKYRVPVRMGVAPVQTYIKYVTVEASNKREAANKIRDDLLDDLVNSAGWKSVGGRMETTLPHLTTYDTYLDEQDLERWVQQP